jgi:transcriptional regulator with XRE-family HTH domain
MTKVSDLHRKWSADPAYKAAYGALAGEYAIAEMLIRARALAGLSQTEVAKRMNTSQSYVARLETGQLNPTTDTLGRYAKAVNAILKFSLAPRTGTGVAFRNKIHQTYKVAAKGNPATGNRIKRDPKGRDESRRRRRA